MKAWTSSKAVPSPGRANKYPPPLMRFLRSNAGSRSRGRSARPTASLFARRKRSTAIDVHQEPSSPKVTCIGQVRVRRSCKPKARTKNKGPRKRKPTSSNAATGQSRFCYWVGNPPALCCRIGCFRPPWRQWGSLFRCRKFWVRSDSGQKESVPAMDRDIAVEEERQEERKSPRGRDCRIPPKNALILARCTSAPHRSSYLASRLWGSPLHENRESSPVKEGKENYDLLEMEQAAPESESKGNAPNEANSAMVAPKTGVLRRSKSEPGRRSGDPLTTSFWTETTTHKSSFLCSAYSVDHKYSRNLASSLNC